MKKSLIIFITILIICSFNLFADTNFRVMSYNALNFDGTDKSAGGGCSTSCTSFRVWNNSGDDKDLANRLSEFSDGMNVKEWVKNVYTNK